MVDMKIQIGGKKDYRDVTELIAGRFVCINQAWGNGVLLSS